MTAYGYIFKHNLVISAFKVALEKRNICSSYLKHSKATFCQIIVSAAVPHVAFPTKTYKISKSMTPEKHR